MMGRGENVISLEQVAKRYRRGPLVLSGVDLTLTDGEIVVLSGSNGSGKSTVLRIVAGLTRPSSGRVSGIGTVVSYLPEAFPSDLRASATEYLTAMAGIRGVPSTAADDVLAELRFTGDRAAPMSSLSKGNRQKVALAQALLADTGPLVLDEPWSGLDTLAADRLGRLLATCATGGRVVLMTDHGGHARRITGVRNLRMNGGSVVPDDGARPTMLVELRCPPGIRGRIKTMAGVESSVSDEAVLSLRVATDECDRLLMAVLGAGCSVLAVYAPGTSARRR